MKYQIENFEKHLRVYEDKSEYHVESGKVEIFQEGTVEVALYAIFLNT